MVSTTGDTDRCWDGEEDQGPGQKHKVRELTALLKIPFCPIADVYQLERQAICQWQTITSLRPIILILCTDFHLEIFKVLWLFQSSYQTFSVSGEWDDLQTRPQHGENISSLPQPCKSEEANTNRATSQCYWHKNMETFHWPVQIQSLQIRVTYCKLKQHLFQSGLAKACVVTCPRTQYLSSWRQTASVLKCWKYFMVSLFVLFCVCV